VLLDQYITQRVVSVVTNVYRGNIELSMIFQLPYVLTVQMVGCLIRVAPTVNPVKRVRLVTLPVKNAKIVQSVNFVRVKQKMAMALILPNAVIVQWGGRLKRVVLNANVVNRVRLVTLPVKNAKIVLPVNFVQVKQKMVLALIQPNALVVQRVGIPKQVALNANVVKRVCLVTLPVKNAKIVLPVNFVLVKQKLAMRLILLLAMVAHEVGRLISGALNAIRVFQANIKMKKENRLVKCV